MCPQFDIGLNIFLNSRPESIVSSSTFKYFCQTLSPHVMLNPHQLVLHYVMMKLIFLNLFLYLNCCHDFSWTKCIADIWKFMYMFDFCILITMGKSMRHQSYNENSSEQNESWEWWIKSYPRKITKVIIKYEVFIPNNKHKSNIILTVHAILRNMHTYVYNDNWWKYRSWILKRRRKHWGTWRENGKGKI